MRVLIVNTHDQQGGAAIAAYRLLEALHKNNVSVEMLTLHKQYNNERVVQVGHKWCNRARFVAERAVIYARNRFSRKHLFDVSIANTGVAITRHAAFKRADIIHLHWINQGMLSLPTLKQIVESGKKIVWTMHDMWPFTGICHHAGSCNHFTHGCGNCPYLVNPKEKDLSHTLFSRKEQIYAKGNIHFVGCSRWLSQLALQSPLTLHQRVSTVANPLDIEMFAPKNKQRLRESMKLPLNKKIILFAAAKVSDRRKGIDYLIEASRILANEMSNEAMFLIAGAHSREIAPLLALPAKEMGYVAAKDMPNLYSVADLFVTPSLQENLPNTIMEAMACGTPCVGFSIGGIPEMIDHEQNGYVANYKDAHDLAKGMKWVMLEASQMALATHARNKVVHNYREEVIVREYVKIYNEE